MIPMAFNLKDWKFYIFSRLNIQSVKRNYVIPYKDPKKLKY
jgi:hypothetical protein